MINVDLKFDCQVRFPNPTPKFILFNIHLILLIFHRDGLIYALYIIGGILVAGTLANIHAWAKALGSLFVSQSRHLKKALKNNEGAPLTALGAEVSLMTDMVKVGPIIDFIVDYYRHFPKKKHFFQEF